MSEIYVEFGKPIDDYCEVSSCSFGMGSSSILAGTNRQASVHDVTFLKESDSMSQKIWRASMDGTSFNTVWVEFYSGDDNDPYMVYTLGNVFVASVSVHGTTETVGLNFKTMKSKYSGR